MYGSGPKNSKKKPGLTEIDLDDQNSEYYGTGWSLLPFGVTDTDLNLVRMISQNTDTVLQNEETPNTFLLLGSF